MDHDAFASFGRAEHLAQHVSRAMEAVATLLDDPGQAELDYHRVPDMFAGCAHCTIEALLYLSARVFLAARWDPARIREEIPTVVGQVLGTEVG